MTQASFEENVDIIRRAYADVHETGELSTELTHPDFVWDMSHYTGWPEQQVYSGREAANRFISDWRGTWDDFVLEVKSFHDAGNKVVVIVHQAGRSKSTGVRVEMDFAQLFTVEGGLQVRMDMYDDPDEAFAAAGITP